MEMMSVIGRLLARYQAEGVLRPEHPLHAVAALLGPIMVINLMRSIRPDMAPRWIWRRMCRGFCTADPQPGLERSNDSF